MSRTFKHYAKQACLVFAILLFTVSCEKENIIIQEESQDKINPFLKKEVTVKQVSLNEINKNSTISNSLMLIKNQLDFNRQAKNSLTDNSIPINSFTVLTNEIIKVTTNTSETYAFRIESPTDPESKYENFIIEKVGENDFEYYIYKYKETENNNTLNSQYAVSRTLLSSDPMILVSVPLLFSQR